MSVMLPSELVWLLDVIGIDWPDVDEDELRASADDYRAMADHLEDLRVAGTQASYHLTAGSSKGEAIEAFAAAWEKTSKGHLQDFADALRVMGTVLDGAAVAVEIAKGAVVVQLGILAASIAAATAAAAFTFGLSEAAALAETTVCREICRRLLRELEQQLIDYATGMVEDAVVSVIEGIVVQLATDGLNSYLGDGDVPDLGKALDSGLNAGTTGVREGLGI
ncbi:WXG100 family type VII secretion target [Peterkaempfera bronchialis]|uniref:Outer membrane channel protein CpnT-like N-terminal domain-containing protein n=1 Tax=Peterkaempfera bronchialis TaxID=2126346 RepID=A0A345T2R2_9ACTN|nr:WXG100 family type VII secretion target [Peterkaempfera bronchialis]AXI80267.1 hypothetical protein C7M71_025580 [Peterkaempfera bronchialis]